MEKWVLIYRATGFWNFNFLEWCKWWRKTCKHVKFQSASNTKIQTVLSRLWTKTMYCILYDIYLTTIHICANISIITELIFLKIRIDISKQKTNFSRFHALAFLLNFLFYYLLLIELSFSIYADCIFEIRSSHLLSQLKCGISQ